MGAGLLKLGDIVGTSRHFLKAIHGDRASVSQTLRAAWAGHRALDQLGLTSVGLQGVGSRRMC